MKAGMSHPYQLEASHVLNTRTKMSKFRAVFDYDHETNFFLLLQGVLEDQPYPWYAGVVCAFLVLASVLFLPGVALLRKLGILHYERAKAMAADLQGTTSSTTKFLGSQMSTCSMEQDGTTDIEKPEPEKPIQFTIDDFRASSKDSAV